MRWMIVVALATGCVSKGRYELLEVQLDATRTAVAARSVQSADDQRALEARVAELEAEIAERQVQLQGLAAEAATRDAELSVRQAELAALYALLPAASPDAPAPPPEVEALRAQVTDALAVASARAVRDEAIAEGIAAVEQAFAALVEADRLTVESDAVRGVVRVVIPLGQLFQEGWTTLSPRGEVLAVDLAGALQALPGRTVRVEGHTDVRPRHSVTFASNRERSFDAALVVTRALEAEKVPVPLGITGWGGLHPRSAGDTPEANAANARIELVVDVRPETLPAFPIEVETSDAPPAPEAPGEASAADPGDSAHTED